MRPSASIVERLHRDRRATIPPRRRRNTDDVADAPDGELDRVARERTTWRPRGRPPNDDGGTSSCRIKTARDRRSQVRGVITSTWDLRGASNRDRAGGNGRTEPPRFGGRLLSHRPPGKRHRVSTKIFSSDKRMSVANRVVIDVGVIEAPARRSVKDPVRPRCAELDEPGTATTWRADRCPSPEPELPHQGAGASGPGELVEERKRQYDGTGARQLHFVPDPPAALDGGPPTFPRARPAVGEGE